MHSLIISLVECSHGHQHPDGVVCEYTREAAAEKECFACQVEICQILAPCCWTLLHVLVMTIDSVCSLVTASHCRQKLSIVDGDESLGLFRQLCSAIEYCHEQGIIHRDIKVRQEVTVSPLWKSFQPANLFVKPERGHKLTLKLGDFGLSCLDSAVVTPTQEGEKEKFP